MSSGAYFLCVDNKLGSRVTPLQPEYTRVMQSWRELQMNETPVITRPVTACRLIATHTNKRRYRRGNTHHEVTWNQPRLAPECVAYMYRVYLGFAVLQTWNASHSFLGKGNCFNGNLF
ncbi:hypothetical protein TNCT_667191 [Trichonephila clavata]|uniref:Uncharacterized protein n=1 Tax=Trichonephila clavata TaxID=2740835 RepID=A0A8X6M270_TRICU|nr:hypothetical protein TNCT_667191 [Trichonephila clavata]